jgi:hypothetical protein
VKLVKVSSLKYGQIKKEVNKMRRITLSIVAMAILTLVGGMAFADTFTIDNSEQEGTKGTAAVNAYTPFAISGAGFCSATAGGTGNCNAHGNNAVKAWLDEAYMSSGGSATGTAYLFRDTTDTSLGGAGSGAGPSTAWNNQGTLSQFNIGAGLPTNWLGTLRATSQLGNAATASLTAPSSSNRDEWVDQIAIGYVASSEFAQNFRSQLTFGNTRNAANRHADGSIIRENTAYSGCLTNEADCATMIDQRLEQGDSNPENGGEDSGYAFQQAFAATSGPYTEAGLVSFGGNITASVGQTTSGGDKPTNIAGPGGSIDNAGCAGGDPECDYGSNDEANDNTQNIEQSTEGFFFSCMNCSVSNEHSFTPPKKLEFQTWPTRPKITKINHADAATQTTWTP